MEKLINHLNERFVIDHNKGEVVRRDNGVVCNTPDSYGYTQVCCGKYEGKRKMMKRHQIIFLTYNGYLPNYQQERKSIDHKDSDRKNDSIQNLREADSRLQQRNVTIPSKGIVVRKGKFRARIRDNNSKQFEKNFDTYEEALSWRLDKEEELWYEHEKQRHP